MAWDKIDAADYTVWKQQNNFNAAIANSKKRLSQNKQFQLIDENAKWINDRSDDNSYSLQIKKFKLDQATLEADSKKYKSISDYKNELKFSSLPYELAAMEKDTLLKEKRVRWHENLAKDIYVEEALNVLDDLQIKQTSKEIFPVRKKEKLVKS
jgi:carboxyl-terminal processing protease